MHRASPTVALLTAAAFAGAAAAQAPPPDPSTYVSRLEAEGERNRVLNQMEIGARYFWSAKPDEAASAFDDAIQKIETVFSNDPSVTKARSLWYEEGAKTFKGEPYERAMVYYYRGLIYLRKGDYENARAAFRQGQMQDAFAEEEQNQTDFGVLLFLEAWASHLNGDSDLRDETLKRLTALHPEFPGIGDGDDTLVLVETGTAPRKLGDGLNHSYFVFRRGKGFKENRAELVLGETATPLYPIEDIFYQATTRGGREIDKILEGKVAFRQTTGSIGSVLADSSVVLAQQSALGNVGGASGIAAGLGAVGALSLLISANAKPRADTRTWSSLPDTVHIATLASKNLAARVAAVRFLRDGAPARDDLPLNFETDANGKGLAWARSR